MTVFECAATVHLSVEPAIKTVSMYAVIVGTRPSRAPRGRFFQRPSVTAALMHGCKLYTNNFRKQCMRVRARTQGTPGEDEGQEGAQNTPLAVRHEPRCSCEVLQQSGREDGAACTRSTPAAAACPSVCSHQNSEFCFAWFVESLQPDMSAVTLGHHLAFETPHRGSRGACSYDLDSKTRDRTDPLEKHE